MPAKPSLSALAAEWKDLLLHYQCVVNARMTERKAMHIELLHHHTQCNNRSYSLFDLKEVRFVAHYSAYCSRLANPMIRLDDPDNWKNLYRHCHKCNEYYYIESVIHFFRELMSLPLGKRSHMVMNTLHWLKNKEGEYDLYLIHVKVIETDDLGNPWLILVETELLPGFKPRVFRPIRQLLLIDPQTNAVEKRFPVGKNDELRGTQLELLRLLNDNPDLKSLAATQGISINNLKSRCTRILRNLNASNVPQAVTMTNYLRLL
jgi:DNA-binding CsgD family transcriptional regulator